MTTEHIIIGALAVINIITFLVMANDKRRSTRSENTHRISEGLIFFLATIGGSVGVYAGMLIFRHKTKRWYFQLGIPLIILQNFATLYLLREVLIGNW